jgi:hypothetical protein
MFELHGRRPLFENQKNGSEAGVIGKTDQR